MSSSFNLVLCIFILSNPAPQHSKLIPLFRAKLQNILLIFIILLPFSHHSRGRDGQIGGVSPFPSSLPLLHLILSSISSSPPSHLLLHLPHSSISPSPLSHPLLYLTLASMSPSPPSSLLLLQWYHFCWHPSFTHSLSSSHLVLGRLIQIKRYFQASHIQYRSNNTHNADSIQRWYAFHKSTNQKSHTHPGIIFPSIIIPFSPSFAVLLHSVKSVTFVPSSAPHQLWISLSWSSLIFI